MEQIAVFENRCQYLLEDKAIKNIDSIPREYIKQQEERLLKMNPRNIGDLNYRRVEFRLLYALPFLWFDVLMSGSLSFLQMSKWVSNG